jgi:DNA-binding NtrC family response regulator
VRELRNLVERLAILCEGPVVSGAEAEALLPRRRAVAAPALPGTVAPGPGPLALPTAPAPRYRPDRSFRDQVDEAERDIILGALSFAHDNATEAARLLDLERGHFYKKLKSLGLKRAGGETQVEGPPEG